MIHAGQGGYGLALLALLVAVAGLSAGAVRPQLAGVDEEAALFILASAALAAVGLTSRRGPVLANVNQVVAPVLIAVLLVLQCLPRDSAAYTLWPPLAVFFTAFAAQFACAVVLSAVGSGELTAAQALVPPLLLYAAGRLAGLALDIALADVADVYAYYPIVLTVLLCAMQVVAILQLRGPALRAAAHPGASDLAQASTQVAEDLARAYGLTPRENDVLRLLLQGYSSAAIGATLVISENTVRTHRKNIYRKMGVSSRDGLIAAIGAGGTAARSDPERRS